MHVPSSSFYVIGTMGIFTISFLHSPSKVHLSGSTPPIPIISPPSSLLHPTVTLQLSGKVVHRNHSGSFWGPSRPAVALLSPV